MENYVQPALDGQKLNVMAQLLAKTIIGMDQVPTMKNRKAKNDGFFLWGKPGI